MLHEFHGPFVVHVVKEPSYVRIEDPVHFLPLDARVQRIQRLMRTASWPKSIRKAPKIHLVDLVEDRHDCLLHDLVFQRRDAQRPLFLAVGFRYVHSSRWLRPVRSTVYPAMEIFQPIFQTVFVLLPPHTVHSRRGVPLQRVIALPEHLDAQMVEQSREPFLLLFLRCFAYAVQPLGHSFPALGRTRVGLFDVLLGLRSSLHNLRRGCPFVRLFHGYYNAVRLLAGVHVRLVAFHLPGPVCCLLRRRQRGLPVLVHVVSRRAWALRLRRTQPWLAILSPSASVAFPLTLQGRHPVLDFRSSITRPTDASVYASPAASRRLT